MWPSKRTGLIGSYDNDYEDNYDYEEDPIIPCTTKDGKKCQLPFIYQGEKYEACPPDPDVPNETWCSTRTNRDGEHVGAGGHYGFCGDSCPKIWYKINKSWGLI